MTAPEISIWWRVDIVGRDKSNPASTKTFRVTNRMHPNAFNMDGYRCVLTQIRGIGYQMGLYLPSPIRGSITIDDSMDSWGFGMKFSDYFERYTFVDQSISVAQAVTEPDDGFPEVEYAYIWTGKIASYRRFGGRDQAVTFDVQSLGITDRPVTRMIDSTSFPNAPITSYGRHIPLCIGSNVQVQGIPIDVAATEVDYALGVTLGTQFPMSSVATLGLVKDFEGNWALTRFTSTPNTAVLESASTTDAAITPFSDWEYLYRIPEGGFVANAYCITHVTGYWRGQVANTTTDGELIVKIYSLRHDGSTWRPDKVIATGAARKSDYSANINVASDFAVTVALDRPVPVNYIRFGIGGTGVTACAISASQTGASTSTCRPSVYSLGSSTTQWSRPTGYEFGLSGVGVPWRYQLFGMSRTDTLTGTGVDIDGLGYAYTTLGMRSAVALQVSPDISKLEWIFTVQGLKDDGSGTITGSAGSVIESPYYAMKALLQEWNGSSWVAGSLGTLHSDSLAHVAQVTSRRYDRLCQGRTEGRTSRLKMLEQICREHGCRIGQYLTSSSANLFVYAWGTTRASVATITDEDAQIVSHQVADSASVVNRVDMNYGRRLATVGTIEAQEENSLNSLSQVLRWTKETGALQASYATVSEALFGKRALETSQFFLISTSSTASAEHMAEMFLAENAFPEEKVELEVPYLAYRDRNLCDVVTIVHPELPCHGGSEFDVPDPYYDSGSAATAGSGDLLEGHYLKKASAYRAQIEGRLVSWNVGEFPTLRLLARLLTQPKDPT